MYNIYDIKKCLGTLKKEPSFKYILYKYVKKLNVYKKLSLLTRFFKVQNCCLNFQALQVSELFINCIPALISVILDTDFLTFIGNCCLVYEYHSVIACYHFS